VQSKESKLAFISEEPEQTSTDYLVDAIIELSSEVSFGSILRRMHVNKLRGMSIATPTLLYTLNDGRFRILEPPKILLPGQYAPKKYRPIANVGDRYSSGIPDLDRMLGGGLYRGLTIAL